MANTPNAAISPVYPGHVLQSGSSGSEVARVQKYLDALRVKYPTLTSLTVDGRYGSGTSNTVKQYQAITKLSIDGKVGRDTWNALIADYNRLTEIDSRLCELYNSIWGNTGCESGICPL